MTSAAAMEAELASVLADPTFVRSPVLTRLLAYLVETTVSGDGGHLKSYSVAVDGLGRSPELDPQVDTYARVQVARLRKALDGFYAAAGAERTQRLAIGNGSYEVLLLPNGRCPAEAPPGQLTAPRRRLLAATALFALFAMAAVAAFLWPTPSRITGERWRNGAFPSVTVDVRSQTDARSDAAYADVIRQELLIGVNRYQSIRTYYDSTANASYAINVNLYRSGEALLANTFLVDQRNDRLVWSTSDIVDVDTAGASSRESAYLARISFTIAHATGLIHSSERRYNHPADTPYGCWLRFTMQALNNHVIDDPVLAECAEAWHEAEPDHPLAAGLYAWSLLDKSIVTISDAKREKLLEKALRVTEDARAMNPSFGFLPAVAVRGYGLANEDLAMRTAAERALELNPGNPEIQGLVGSMLALHNDPRGEAIIDQAIARHPNPPPWYFTGKFIAAMMHDDTAKAARALVQLKQINHTLPVLPIFSAAYEARTGHLARARTSWARAKEMQPILRIDPDIFFKRTPLTPEVTARLKEWLAPILN